MSSLTSPFPVYQHVSGWNQLLPKRRARHTSPLQVSYRFAVIGAGYTGLAAARRLAELNPDDDILLIDAGEIGEGSSGRNSGFLISLPHNSSHRSISDVKKQIRIYESGRDWLKQIVDQYKIECGWNAAGKYHCAATHAGTKTLKATLHHMRDWGVEIRKLARDELFARFGTDYYQYGFHTSHNTFVQPAALVRGLADSLPTNVTLQEREPVLGLNTKASGTTIRLTDKTVQADTIIIANNSFAKELGILNSRLITIYTYAGITPELDSDVLNQHGSEREWGIIPANRLGTTLRKINDRRFMLRSAYSYEKELPASRARAILTDCYKRRYPGLRHHDFEHVWGGVTALTRNGATFFGPIANNVYASVGCNGVGILKGSAYGRLLAETIMGGQSALLTDVLSLSGPSWIPPEPLRQLAVTTAINFHRHKAGREF